jgi:peptide-methionine (S)-S-oxide reductase
MPVSPSSPSTATASVASESITLAGGCFWCIEAVFEQVQGVLSAVSGYSNGDDPDPTYESVCSGRSGHAEVVRVTFDPAVIHLRDVLEIFFVVHDPTTLNRQGNDVGTQYRSAIYFEQSGQVTVVNEVLQQVKDLHGSRVVTQVEALRNHHRAEDEHQHYFARHPYQGYCAGVIAPKVAKFQKTFAQRVKR